MSPAIVSTTAPHGVALQRGRGQGGGRGRQGRGRRGRGRRGGRCPPTAPVPRQGQDNDQGDQRHQALLEGVGYTPDGRGRGYPQQLGQAGPGAGHGPGARSSWVSTTWRTNPPGARRMKGAQMTAKQPAAAANRAAWRRPAGPASPIWTARATKGKGRTPCTTPPRRRRPRRPQAPLRLRWPASKAASIPTRHHRSQ